MSYSADYLIVNRALPTKDSYTNKESHRLNGEKKVFNQIQSKLNFLPTQTIKIEEHHKAIEQIEDLLELLQKTPFEK